MVIPYETSLNDLINIIDQHHNIKVNLNNLYFKNGIDDRINLVDEEDWIVARFEAKEAMSNKIVFTGFNINVLALIDKVQFGPR
ncbi:12160_t:CDS:2 [Funneliformis mosseae]|uniref:12160_t:CDS:1 n=1 Tax=Funneliformis mosseae TaxID=27381 RepID=A0A9N9CYB2_FUNMO|nr:12160_t:CDS:2 [Funneliformis mosseae]